MKILGNEQEATKKHILTLDKTKLQMTKEISNNIEENGKVIKLHLHRITL